MVTQKTGLSAELKKQPDHTGVFIGITLIGLWIISTYLCVSGERLPALWLIVPLMLLQTHLYTGLFITAHDAMHGLVAPNRWLNDAIGWLAAILFAFNWYGKLLPKHHAHHRHVVTETDPDYHEGSFLRWYVSFALEYISWKQILAMAITFNLLKLAFRNDLLILFWILPSVLSTVQLFYFGTYLPHRKNPDFAPNEHKARSQYWGHVWGFISCYFFGYHYEHHALPYVPWWRLWRTVERTT